MYAPKKKRASLQRAVTEVIGALSMEQRTDLSIDGPVCSWLLLKKSPGGLGTAREIELVVSIWTIADMVGRSPVSSWTHNKAI